jgi:hypothetical protein
MTQPRAKSRHIIKVEDNRTVTADSLQKLINSLEFYSDALGQPVIAVFQVDAVLCCRLANNLIVGAQFTIEYGQLEVILGRMQDMPKNFCRPIQPLPVQQVLTGRLFRGFTLSADGDLGFDFGQCILQFVRYNGTAVLTPAGRFNHRSN